jgi:hypothetical protein
MLGVRFRFAVQDKGALYSRALTYDPKFVLLCKLCNYHAFAASVSGFRRLRQCGLPGARDSSASAPKARGFTFDDVCAEVSRIESEDKTFHRLVYPLDAHHVVSFRPSRPVALWFTL